MKKIGRHNLSELNFKTYRSLDSGAGAIDLCAAFIKDPFEVQELYSRRVLTRGGYVCLGLEGWPCGLASEDFGRFLAKGKFEERRTPGDPPGIGDHGPKQGISDQNFRI